VAKKKVKLWKAHTEDCRDAGRGKFLRGVECKCWCHKSRRSIKKNV